MRGLNLHFFTSLFFQRAKYCPMFFSFCFPINPIPLNRTIYNITGCRKYLYFENLNKDIKVVHVQGSHFFLHSPINALYQSSNDYLVVHNINPLETPHKQNFTRDTTPVLKIKNAIYCYSPLYYM